MSRRSVRRQKLENIRISSGFEIAMYQKAGRYCFRSDDLIPCVCGEDPVIEHYIYGSPADLVVRCPGCDRRGAATGPYELVRDDWNARHYSADSAMVAEKMDYMQDEGFIQLMGVIFNPPKKESKPRKKKANAKAA